MTPLAELTTLIRHHGAAFVAANVFAEQIGLPIPAVPTLVLAGALTMREDFSVTSVMLLSVAASLVADGIWFLLGRRRGNRILQLLCRISLSPDSCVRQTEQFFDRWGSASLLFAKFIPGLSTVAPPLAGASGIGAAAFIVYDGVGAAIWAGAAIAAGRVFHRAIDQVLVALERLGSWAFALLGSLLLLFILWRWIERQRFFERLRVARITPDELMAMIAAGVRVTIADARTESARRRDGRSLPGAIAVDPANIDATITALSPHEEIVLYCT